MRIYVDHLSHEVTKDELRQEFATFGEVGSVTIVSERYSGRAAGGFAFVDMPSKPAGIAAVTGLNGKTLRLRSMSVSAMREFSSEKTESDSFSSRREDVFNRASHRKY